MTRLGFVIDPAPENGMAGHVVLRAPAPGSMEEVSTDPCERFEGRIEALRTAQLAVQEQLEPLQEAQAPDGARAALLRLHGSVDRLVARADALLSRMSECGASGSLVEAAESLSDFFWDTRKRIATML